MAALRKENLVQGGKYNRAEIMKRAWAYYRNPLYIYKGNFKKCLHAAWVDAQLVMDDFKLDMKNEPIFPNKGLKPSDLYNTLNMRMGYVCR